MSQRVYRISILLFILFLSLNMFYYVTSTTDYPKPQMDIDPYRGQSCVHARLYYVDGQKISYESIDYESHLSYGLDELLERYLRQSGEHAPLDVIDLYEEQNRIYLNLRSNTFRSDKYNTANIERYLMSLVNTLTDMQPQKQVQLLFDGKVLKDKIHGFDVQRPLARNETLVYTADADIPKIYENFLDELLSADYYGATCMLTFHDSGAIRQSELHDQLLAYQEKVIGYLAKSVHVKRTGDTWQLLVQANSPQGVLEESWEIIKINKRFYINYARSPLSGLKK